MKPRAHETFQWGPAIAISLLLHGLFLWQQDILLYSADGEQNRHRGVTRLSFRTLPKPVPPAPTPQAAPEPRPTPPIEPRPAPRPRPLPRAKKPALKPVPKPKPVVEQQEVIKESTPPTTEAPPSIAQPAGDDEVIAQARRNYFGELAAHIESHKYYPRAARRRGIQGVIQVTFRLLENGSITDLEIRDGHKLLRAATEQALQKAQPLPQPPPQLSTPLNVSYGMEYLLH